jgi:hypothetical protein
MNTRGGAALECLEIGASSALRMPWYLQRRGRALEAASIERPPRGRLAHRWLPAGAVRRRLRASRQSDGFHVLHANRVKGWRRRSSDGSRHGFPVLREQDRTLSAERLDRDIGARRVVLVVRTVERLSCARFPATARRAGGLAVDDRRGASKAFRRQRDRGRRRPGADRRGYRWRWLHTDPCALVPSPRLQPSIGRVPLVSRPKRVRHPFTMFSKVSSPRRSKAPRWADRARRV